MTGLHARLVAALLVVLGSVPARAQQAVSLAEVTGLSCEFPAMTMGTWTKSGDASIAPQPSQLEVEFNSINTIEGSANLKGGTGNLVITLMLLGGNLHLVVTNPGGALYLTTVAPSETRPGRYRAVHTRHELTETAVVLPGYTTRPEQYVGDCALVK
jgi:hypothetical protein